MGIVAIELCALDQRHDIRCTLTRALVLGRRNYLFAGSDAGGETAACLYSLIGTCRLNGIDPHAYLRHVLERIPAHPINRIEDLLPWRVAPQLPLALLRAA